MGEPAKLHSDLEGLVGTTIHDRYRVDALIGAGGMGAVFKGYHTGLKRDVAIKLLHPDIGRDDSLSKRFDREAYSASRLDHPNCVRVSDFGTTETGAKYLVMEYLEGAELKASLSPPRAPLDAVRIAKQILAGLEHAHHFGVVHRDLKPENVFVTHDYHGQQLVKLVDFGIAKLLDGEGTQEKLTRTGLVFGTPRYMSPEQASGGKIDERTDLYATGLIFYEMLAGQPPFVSEDPGQLLRMQIMAPPPSLPASVPVHVVAVVEKLLEKSKTDRYATAREVIAALDIVERELIASPALAAAPPLPPGSAMTVPDGFLNPATFVGPATGAILGPPPAEAVGTSPDSSISSIKAPFDLLGPGPSPAMSGVAAIGLDGRGPDLNSSIADAKTVVTAPSASLSAGARPGFAGLVDPAVSTSSITIARIPGTWPGQQTDVGSTGSHPSLPIAATVPVADATLPMAAVSSTGITVLPADDPPPRRSALPWVIAAMAVLGLGATGLMVSQPPDPEPDSAPEQEPATVAAEASGATQEPPEADAALPAGAVPLNVDDTKPKRVGPKSNPQPAKKKSSPDEAKPVEPDSGPKPAPKPQPTDDSTKPDPPAPEPAPTPDPTPEPTPDPTPTDDTTDDPSGGNGKGNGKRKKPK